MTPEEEKTLKEELFKIKTYEEFDKQRERFRGLRLFDRDVLEHMGKLCGKADLCDGELKRKTKDGNYVWAWEYNE